MSSITITDSLDSIKEVNNLVNPNKLDNKILLNES
jgi:hypothetical protein